MIGTVERLRGLSLFNASLLSMRHRSRLHDCHQPQSHRNFTCHGGAFRREGKSPRVTRGARTKGKTRKEEFIVENDRDVPPLVLHALKMASRPVTGTRRFWLEHEEEATRYKHLMKPVHLAQLLTAYSRVGFFSLDLSVYALHQQLEILHKDKKYALRTSCKTSPMNLSACYGVGNSMGDSQFKCHRREDRRGGAEVPIQSAGGQGTASPLVSGMDNDSNGFGHASAHFSSAFALLIAVKRSRALSYERVLAPAQELHRLLLLRIQGLSDGFRLETIRQLLIFLSELVDALPIPRQLCVELLQSTLAAMRRRRQEQSLDTSDARQLLIIPWCVRSLVALPSFSCDAEGGFPPWHEQTYSTSNTHSDMEPVEIYERNGSPQCQGLIRTGIECITKCGSQWPLANTHIESNGSLPDRLDSALQRKVEKLGKSLLDTTIRDIRRIVESRLRCKPIEVAKAFCGVHALEPGLDSSKLLEFFEWTVSSLTCADFLVLATDMRHGGVLRKDVWNVWANAALLSIESDGASEDVLFGLRQWMIQLEDGNFRQASGNTSDNYGRGLSLCRPSNV